jgi:hypothetical protein
MHPPSEAPRDQAQPTVLLIWTLFDFNSSLLGYKVHISGLLTESSSVVSRTTAIFRSIAAYHAACTSFLHAVLKPRLSSAPGRLRISCEGSIRYLSISISPCYCMQRRCFLQDYRTSNREQRRPQSSGHVRSRRYFYKSAHSLVRRLTLHR